MLVGMGVGSVLLTIVAQLWIYTAFSFTEIINYGELTHGSRRSFDNLTRDIRAARIRGSYATNQLTFTNLDGTSFTYGWNPDTAVVYRLSGGSSNVLVTGCNYFCFQVWQRNATNGLLFPYSATNQTSVAKLVDVSWSCSRTNRSRTNPESIQTARIAMRN